MTIRDCSEQLLALQAQFVSKAKPPVNGRMPHPQIELDEPTAIALETPDEDNPADEEVVKKVCRARKFAALWKGEWETQGYPSQSEADLSLCGRIAHFVGAHPILGQHKTASINRIFQKSQLSKREKWNSASHGRAGSTYGQDTVATALAGTTEFYDWNQEDAGSASAIGAAERLQKITAAVQEKKNPDLVFDEVPFLATLSAADLGRAKAAFKEAVGKALNLNDLTAALNEAKKKHRHLVNQSPSDVDGLAFPAVVITDRPLRDQAADALGALVGANDPPSLFVRAGAITRVRADEDHRPIIEPLGEAALRGILTRQANFYQISEQGERHIDPPLSVVRDVLALGEWPLPPLEAVVEAPVLRPDGTILNTPGYDPATRLFYAPQAGLRLPAIAEEPTQEKAQEACAFIFREALGEFPYTGPADRANAAGLLLTPIIRQAIHGQVPIGVVDSPRAGTGKGLLSSVVAIIPTGRPAGMMSAPEDEDEWRKQITSALLSGATVIVIDNVEGRLSSATLSRAVTATTWADRLLGTNQQPPLPQRATWVVNGNNVQLGGDIPRRCFRIRLDAKVEQPWLRSGFRHPQLLDWIQQHRGRLLAALLIMARAWYVAGKPAAATPALGSFEDWSRTVGGILAYAGVEHFLSNLSEMYEQADDGVSQWAGFFVELRKITSDQAVTSGEIASYVLTDPELRQVLPDVLLTKLDRSRDAFTLALGQALPRQVDIRHGELRLIRAGTHKHRKCPLWRIHSDEKQD